jgi:hypothetical protein
VPHLRSLPAKVGYPTKRKTMGCLGMPAVPFDSTRRGREDEPGGQSAKKESLFFSTYGGGSWPVVGYGGVGLAGKG